MTRPAVQYDNERGWITRRFLGGLSVLTLMSLAVSAGFFAFTPRVWFGPRNIFGDETVGPSESRKSVTGFAREVRLGELGEILESVAPVLSIRCYDAQTGDAVPLGEMARRLGMEEALFRGAVMTEYDDGRWYPERNDQPVKVGRVYNRSGFKQEITLEQTADEVLFCVGTPEAVEIAGRGEDGYLQLATGVLTREVRPESRQRMSYNVYVAPVAPKLAEIHATPVPRALWWQHVESSYLLRNQQFDATRLPEIAAIARQRLEELKQTLGRDPSPFEIARSFEGYFRESSDFGYSLKLSVVDPTIDPIEDFLLNRKEGHCEYFASALTLMLRAAGVPARLVSGFKGAEYSEIRGAWEVQERYAHVWVEAWTEQNVWVTLDPTPSTARNESVATVSSKLGFWGRLRSTSSTVWQDYVVNVNLRQQQNELYRPLREFFEKLVAIVRNSLTSWKSLWSYVVHVLTHPQEWLSVTGGVVTFIVLSVLALLARSGWRFVSWLRGGGWARWRARTLHVRMVVAFYERFLAVLKKAGIQRQPTQTPREFAEVVRERLSALLAEAELPQLPERICEAFYRVRFGGEELHTEEVDWINSHLGKFEAMLIQSPRPKTT